MTNIKSIQCDNCVHKNRCLFEYHYRTNLEKICETFSEEIPYEKKSLEEKLIADFANIFNEKHSL